MFLLKPSKLKDSNDSHNAVVVAPADVDEGLLVDGDGACSRSMWFSSCELDFRVLSHTVHCRTASVCSVSSVESVSMYSIMMSFSEDA